jgi:TatD DNase family protein
MITTAVEGGLAYAVNIGTNLEDAKKAIEFAEKYPFIYAAVGMYPSEAQYAGDELDAQLYEIEKMLSHPKVVALGEIGLDYHYEDTDKAVQQYAFDAQMQIAERLGIPVVIHDRDAHGDTMDTIKRYPSVRGVMHSFSGSAEMARQLANLGWNVSFSGPVTYKNAAKVKEAAVIVPDEALLVETDSPYLPPVPYRGKTNYPGYIAYTVRSIAEIRGKSEAEIAELTLNNAKKFFGIK